MGISMARAIFSSVSMAGTVMPVLDTGECNSEAVQSASQYHLERAASLLVAHATDLRSPCSCYLSAVIHRPFKRKL